MPDSDSGWKVNPESETTAAAAAALPHTLTQPLDILLHLYQSMEIPVPFLG
jgi:hypothetical protein